MDPSDVAEQFCVLLHAGTPWAERPTPESNLVEWVESNGEWEFGINLRYLRKVLQFHFGVEISEVTWREFAGTELPKDVWNEVIRPSMAIRRVAEFIAQQAPRIEFRVANIAGVDCPKAGVFLGLEQIARIVEPEASSIAPSQELGQSLSPRALQRFWVLTRFLTSVPLPRLRNRTDEIAKWTLAGSFVVGIVLSVMAACHLSVGGFGPQILCGGLLTTLFVSPYLTVTVQRVIAPNYLPLPNGIRTFRQLAEFLSKGMSGRMSRP